jgi:hypothetical protein
MIATALEHIDQQATALDEAEALTWRNVELINGYLTRITELESQILHQTAISACRIEERERHQKQIAALQEIAEWERAARLRDTVDYETDDEMMPAFCRDARRQLSEEHPEAFR